MSWHCHHPNVIANPYELLVVHTSRSTSESTTGESCSTPDKVNQPIHSWIIILLVFVNLKYPFCYFLLEWTICSALSSVLLTSILGRRNPRWWSGRSTTGQAGPQSVILNLSQDGLSCSIENKSCQASWRCEVGDIRTNKINTTASTIFTMLSLWSTQWTQPCYPLHTCVRGNKPNMYIYLISAIIDH